MIPFLYNVAQTYFRRFGNEITDFTFVFPNRRAGRFFLKYLAEEAGKPMFSPPVCTIAELFSELSELGPADRIYQLFVLYDCYRELSKTQESFEDFMFWGEMLLNDFDDVDKSLADAEQLFRNIKDLNEIDSYFSYLTPEQVAAIRRFWMSFLPCNEDGGAKKDFLEIWEVLLPLYTTFRERLRSKGLAYEGMIFREVAEKAKRNELPLLKHKRLVFVGMNGHSRSEEYLLEYLTKQHIADFYWDYAHPLVRDKSNRASFFIKNNESKFKSEFELTKECFEKAPEVEVIGVPSSVGQAKQVHSILKRLISEGEFTENHLVPNTAIVLADENLLMPTLYSIPEEVDKINVTMGYGLNNSSISALMNQIFEVNKNFRMIHQELGVSSRYVLPILSHTYILQFVGKAADELQQRILRNNWMVVPLSELKIHPLLELIFTPMLDASQATESLQSILSSLFNAFTSNRLEEMDADDDQPEGVRFFDIECEFIVQYYKSVNRVRDTVTELAVEVNPETFFRLLKKLIAGISISFEGEPLSGLQVMGVLETRTLDFDNLVLLSMNEGIFPVKKTMNSFIPYNLRTGFGLPTYEHQDRVYAYHFYRMIGRAKRIFMVYDSRTEGLNSGEVSRYFYQLKHLYAKSFHIKERIVVYEVPPLDSNVIDVEKTPEVMSRLAAFTEKDGKAISASAINKYVDCPLQFYFMFVEGIQSEGELSEKVESDVFGTIFHKVMEWIYADLEGKTVTADLLKARAKDEKQLTSLLEKAFVKYFFHKETVIRPLEGQILLTGEILKKYVIQTLLFDCKLTPFTYIRSEKKINESYLLPSGLSVNVKGSIDRVDEIDGLTRIIDYKTGSGELAFDEVANLFNREIKKRSKAVMQVFFYALFYAKENPKAVILPGIYFLKEIFKSDFDYGIVHKIPKVSNEKVSNFENFRLEFKSHLDNCLEEIFDKTVPFSQTTNSTICEWCEFKDVCRR